MAMNTNAVVVCQQHRANDIYVAASCADVFVARELPFAVVSCLDRPFRAHGVGEEAVASCC